MRTISKEVYTIDELSKDAQISAWSKSANSFEYLWHDENINSLNAFANIFDINIKDYSYGGQGDHVSWCFNWSSFDGSEDMLNGIRLSKYIWNNYKDEIYQGKYYSLWSKIDKNPHYTKKGNVPYGALKIRHSKVIIELNDSLTGYCMDYTLLKPIHDFMNKPDPDTTFQDLIQICIDNWLEDVQKDYEYCAGFEAFIENAKSNEWEFYSNGDMY